jgi:AcrR family transcriptional regulator
MGRAEDTDQRRHAILEAALGCFHQLGYQKTTMADIRGRARASTGSIYHHFAGKEEVFAALYLDTVRRTQENAVRALRRPGTPRDAVRALVGSYLQWVSRNPERASFLLTMRRAEFGGSAQAELERLNARFSTEVVGWIGRHAARGVVPRLNTDVLGSLLIGPSEEFARRWLRGKTTTPLKTAAAQLADAAWATLRAMAGRRR